MQYTFRGHGRRDRSMRMPFFFLESRADLKTLGKGSSLARRPGSRRPRKPREQTLAGSSRDGRVVPEAMGDGQSRAGLDPKSLDIINAGRRAANRPRHRTNSRGTVLPGTFRTSGRPPLSYKMSACVEKQKTLGVPMVVGAAVRPDACRSAGEVRRAVRFSTCISKVVGRSGAGGGDVRVEDNVKTHDLQIQLCVLLNFFFLEAAMDKGEFRPGVFGNQTSPSSAAEFVEKSIKPGRRLQSPFQELREE